MHSQNGLTVFDTKLITLNTKCVFWHTLSAHIAAANRHTHFDSVYTWKKDIDSIRSK